MKIISFRENFFPPCVQQYTYYVYVYREITVLELSAKKRVNIDREDRFRLRGNVCSIRSDVSSYRMYIYIHIQGTSLLEYIIRS